MIFGRWARAIGDGCNAAAAFDERVEQWLIKGQQSPF
jgi:hypothetical protein